MVDFTLKLVDFLPADRAPLLLLRHMVSFRLKNLPHLSSESSFPIAESEFLYQIGSYYFGESHIDTLGADAPPCAAQTHILLMFENRETRARGRK